MHTLEIENRTILGKTNRRMPKNKMPAVFYGPKEKTTPIVVSKEAFKKVWKGAGESSVITLKADGRELEALIHDIDFDPVKGEPRHADFYILEKGKKVEVKVPVHFEGIPEAVKNLGGILVKVLHEIEIEALPKDLPHSISVDVTSLDAFNSKLLMKDVTLPLNVKSLEDPNEVVAAIAEPREEKEEEPVVAVDLSAIEVEKKGKKEEEGEGEAAPTAAEAEPKVKPPTSAK